MPGDFVKPYYDANGTLHKWVVVTNEPANYNHALHDEPGRFGVVMDKAVYDALPPALNVGGVAVHHAMNKAVASLIAQSNPALSAKLLANASALDAQLASAAQAAATAQASSLAAWKALDPIVQQAALTADAAGLPFVMPIIPTLP